MNSSLRLRSTIYQVNVVLIIKVIIIVTGVVKNVELMELNWDIGWELRKCSCMLRKTIFSVVTWNNSLGGLRDSFVADKLIDSGHERGSTRTRSIANRLPWLALCITLHCPLPSALYLLKSISFYMVCGHRPNQLPIAAQPPVVKQNHSMVMQKTSSSNKTCISTINIDSQPRTRCSSILSFDWLPRILMWTWATERVCTGNASKEFFLNTASEARAP